MIEGPLVTPIHGSKPAEAFASTVLAQVVDATITSFHAVDVGLIRELPSDRFRLLRPIPVLIDVEADGTILASYDLECFGHGGSHAAAAEDFGHCVIELRETLEENRTNLSAHLEIIRQRLSRHIATVA